MADLGEVASEHLDEFWSHSWRTMAWLKYVNILFLNLRNPLETFFFQFLGTFIPKKQIESTILLGLQVQYRNNGFPAFVVAALCACAAFSAAVAGILPIQGGPNQTSIAHAWCTLAGTLGYYVTLFLWQRRTFESRAAPVAMTTRYGTDEA